jgi:predicted MPP superfamily phosphohydrolase
MNRLGVLRFPWLAALSGILAGISAWRYATQVEPNQLEINVVQVPVPGLGKAFAGLRIVQLSDIHLGFWMDRERLDRVVQAALALKPDVAALTGDYLVGEGWTAKHAALLDPLTEGLRPLAQACLAVSVLGNHDHSTNAAAVLGALARAGVVDLGNKVYSLERGADRLFLAGVDDFYTGCADLERVLDMLPPEGPALLLAHEPDFADRSAAMGRFALQISGHTHGGQVVVPFLGPPVLPDHGKKYPAGLYRVGEMLHYTNRGVGMSDLGVRFNCRPEITLFVLSEAVTA